MFPNALRLPGEEGLYGVLDAGGSFTVVSAPVQQEIVPGKPTTMLGYAVDRGGGHTLVNPVIRMERGSNLRVRYWNALDETSIVHWHGFKNDTNNDGHPHYAVGSGETYDYQFTVENRGGTYWYHPHPHHLAGKQAYLGLAGLLLVEDDDELALERALDLRLGVSDIPLLIQDRRIAPDGSLSYAPAAKEQFIGFCGDQVLVNLTPQPCLDCESRLYRFRLVNGSNARVYRLAFTQQTQSLPFLLIGSDGGLLEKPLPASEVFLSPGERADVLLDLRNAAVGDQVMLASLPFDAMEFSAASHARHDNASGNVPNGAPLEIMLIRVAASKKYNRTVPATLSSVEPLASGENLPVRHFGFDHRKGAWRINGQTYEMTDTAFDVARGAREIWSFVSKGAAMPHPVHIHGFQFRVLERRDSPTQVGRLAFDTSGRLPLETGWKDTVLLWPGETLKLLMDFTHRHQGDQVYMLQCHNMEHETHGMMVNFRVAG